MDEGVDFAVGDVAVEVQLYPVAQALVQGVANGGVVCPDFLYFFGGGFYGDGGEVVHVREAEHVIQHVKHEDGVIAAGEFSERRFFGNSVQRQAVVPEFLDIHNYSKSVAVQ